MFFQFFYFMLGFTWVRIFLSLVENFYILKKIMFYVRVHLAEDIYVLDRMLYVSSFFEFFFMSGFTWVRTFLPLVD